MPIQFFPRSFRSAPRLGWPRLIRCVITRPYLWLRALSWIDVQTPAGNIIPYDIHRSVSAEQLKPGRMIVVGDVHGCHDELSSLLIKCGYDQRSDNLVFVGDLVNKGPKSQQVIQTARELGALVSRGNHDDAALAGWHLRQRGNSVKPKLDWVTQLKPQDVAWLEELPFSVSLPDYRLVIVHAGLVPLVPLKRQQMINMSKMRDLRLRPDGSYEAVEEPAEGTQPWGALWPGRPHIIFGHDAKRRLQLHNYCTGLDTGCVYGGDLTACVIPPLEELRGSKAFVRKLDTGEPMTLDDLQGTFVSVEGHEYEPPRARSGGEPARERTCLAP